MSSKSTSPKHQHQWTDEEIALLGKISDGKLARQIGVPTGIVYMKRSTMGIAPSRPFYNLTWGPKELALLGKHPDSEVARMLGVPQKSILNKRRSLGITCYAKSSNFWRAWTPEEIAMLGKRIDADVAETLGISLGSVAITRRKLGIPAFKPRKAPNRPRRSLSDWSEKEIALLGTLTDKQAAETIGLGHATVRIKRISLGIPPCRIKAGRPSFWTPDVLARLGKELDSVIARDIGVSRQRVSQKRAELGIGSGESK